MIDSFKIFVLALILTSAAIAQQYLPPPTIAEFNKTAGSRSTLDFLWFDNKKLDENGWGASIEHSLGAIGSEIGVFQFSYAKGDFGDDSLTQWTGSANANYSTNISEGILGVVFGGLGYARWDAGETIDSRKGDTNSIFYRAGILVPFSSASGDFAFGPFFSVTYTTSSNIDMSLYNYGAKVSFRLSNRFYLKLGFQFEQDNISVKDFHVNERGYEVFIGIEGIPE